MHDGPVVEVPSLACGPYPAVRHDDLPTLNVQAPVNTLRLKEGLNSEVELLTVVRICTFLGRLCAELCVTRGLIEFTLRHPNMHRRGRAAIPHGGDNG